MFRDFINNKLFPILKKEDNNFQKLFFFQIGSCPSCEEYKTHEFPCVLEKYLNKYLELEYYIILIDPEYKNIETNTEELLRNMFIKKK